MQDKDAMAALAGRMAQVMLSENDLKAAQPLLDCLPFAALWIGPGYQVRWANRAAQARYVSTGGKCYERMHGYDHPCDVEGDHPCRSLAAARDKRCAGALHLRNGTTGIELDKIISVPAGDGVLEFHVPVDQSCNLDAVTGLLNRLAIEQIARQNINLLRRLKQPCAVMLIDLDHFKSVNDRYGHAGGDAYLQAVGRTLQHEMRNTDVVGRWGGEEFLVLMPGTERRGASIKAMRVLQALRELRVRHNGQTIAATASAGVWVGYPRIPFEKVYEAADAALYQAKAQGRDRYSFSLEVVGGARPSVPPPSLPHSDTPPDDGVFAG